MVRDVFDFFSRLYDQINPYSAGNVTLFFIWLVVYSLTWMAIWRSNRGWLRFASFVVNQLFSVGIVVSWTVTVAVAAYYWKEAVAAFAATAVIGFLLFRRR